MNLVFKVVRAKNGGLYSANRQVLPDFRVQYIPNTWVSARVGKMFAFRTFEALTHMSFSIAENGEVWLAEADGVEPAQWVLNHPWFLATPSDCEAAVDRFWADGLAFKQFTTAADAFRMGLTRVVENTVVASRIRLLEPVTKDTHKEVLNRLTTATGCDLLKEA